MKCEKCGREFVDTAKFCPYCGTKVNNTVSSGSAKVKREDGWRLAFILYAVLSLSVLYHLPGLITPPGFFFELAGYVNFVAGIGMALLLVLMGVTKDKEMENRFFWGFTGLALIPFINGAIGFISYIIYSIFNDYYFSFSILVRNFFYLIFMTLLLTVMIALAFILLFIGKVNINLEWLKALTGITGGESGYREQSTQKADRAAEKANRAAEKANRAAERANKAAEKAASDNTQSDKGGNRSTPLKTNRGLLGYILLTFLTCGIYRYYFVYSVARDVNTACEGDGKSTGGLLWFLLLSILTCGLYTFWWEYSIGNRLATNAPRYGMSFTENGTSVLMWDIFGFLLCGIGPFIAMNIIIKNTNSICMAYNLKNGFIAL